MPKRRFVKKVGQQVPEMITRLMRVRHPTVEIMWEPQANRWCLVQTLMGVSSLITFLGTADRYEPPTLANTVYYLDRIHPSRFESKFDQERMLREIDENKESENIRKRSADRITEGSRDLYNALTNRLVIPVR